jgi:Transglutaminase-like superfamily
VDRREFLGAAAVICGVRLQVDKVRLKPDPTREKEPHPTRQQKPEPSWRTFEITTHVHVQHAAGTTRVWLPTPVAVAPYQKTLGDNYTIDGGSASMIEREGLDLLAAEWPDGMEPVLTLVSRVATTSHAVDFATPTVPPPRDLSAFSPYLRPLRLESLDAAAVTATVNAVTRGVGTDLDRARAIYEWTLDRHAPDANALFVGLARAAGVPARAVYGLSVSRPDATRAQIARAEVYLVGYGWSPVDLRERRFGSWEMQWIAYNAAQDVALPGSIGKTIAYFMHPHAETDRRRLDSFDPDAFRYSIGVREIE